MYHFGRLSASSRSAAAASAQVWGAATKARPLRSSRERRHGAALPLEAPTLRFLVAAKALLEQNPNPTETEARYWLAGNLCRCTGYDKIVRAVQAAAKDLRRQKK